MRYQKYKDKRGTAGQLRFETLIKEKWVYLSSVQILKDSWMAQHGISEKAKPGHFIMKIIEPLKFEL